MTYKTFRELLLEAKDYDDFDTYVVERGWQAWMNEYSDDNGSGTKLLDILTITYEMGRMSLHDLIASAGSQKKLSDMIGIPYRTINNWSRGIGTPPPYVCDLIAFAIFNSKISSKYELT